MGMTPTQQKALDLHWADMEKNFQWGRVHQAMKALNWAWQGRGVPSIGELKVTARDLLQHMVCEKRKSVRGMGTGGFYVSRHFIKGRSPYYTLEFHLDWWSTEDAESDH